MLLFSLIAVGVTVSATAAAAVMAQNHGTVFPFAPVKPSVADTLGSEAETVFVDDGWSAVTLSRLNEVEDLLDCLEAHNVAKREVRVLGNNCFRVRWK